MSKKPQLGFFVKALMEMEQNKLNENQISLLKHLSDNEIDISKVIWHLEKEDINNYLDQKNNITIFDVNHLKKMGISNSKGDSIENLIKGDTDGELTWHTLISRGKGWPKKNI